MKEEGSSVSAGLLLSTATEPAPTLLTAASLFWQAMQRETMDPDRLFQDDSFDLSNPDFLLISL